MSSTETDGRHQREALVGRFFKGTGASYDRVVAVTTYGLDKSWKRRLLRHVPEDAASILDLACGTGILTMMLHRRCPDARIVGVDITDEYMVLAREKFEGTSADVEFVLSNAETMELEGSFDAVVSCYIPKYVDPNVLLERLDGHVRPGGVIAVHDFDYPRGRIPRALWTMHMAFLNHVGRRVFPMWDEVFDEDLADLIRDSRWAKRYMAALADHGYVDVERESLDSRMASIVTARRPN